MTRGSECGIVGPVNGRIDFQRYRKLRAFVTRTFLHALWWDILLAGPVVRRFRRPPAERWTRIAKRYRALAVEMGGVLIKLGQFLSVRVDLLPAEVTRELSGLQDEVPAERFEDVARQIEADFGRPLTAVFSWVDPVPVGAASLAQVHHARLPGGEPVVVKALRPGIDVLVETDLAAVSLALRLLKFSRNIRKRVDLDRLGIEIVHTTLRELDLANEGRSAERFAADFADDPRVYVPKVFWQWSARRTLTLENVGFLKIGDLETLGRAGIPSAEVARVLYRLYMQQIFVHHFVHSDPHPGNLFVRALPLPGEAAFGPGDSVPPPPPGQERPFQIVFIDFGMVAEIPDHLRAALREYVIGLGTRDPARVVHAYQSAGVLLPGADLTRLEEIHEELFDRFWGVSIGNLRDMALSEARYFLVQYRDLLYEIPFQVQVELLFAMRAVGLLAGLSTYLNPEFDPWAETMPFARRLAKEDLKRDWRGWLDEALFQGRLLLELPRRLDDVLVRAERGGLTVQAALAQETKRTIQRLEKSLQKVAWMVISAALLLAGVMLHTDAPGEPYGSWLMGAAGAAFLWATLGKR
ncbi:MAG TPA: AarF/UbiB family protein [Thermoanaerobaculia bacterium]|nr:AarF/UbiB family protein [Thermoanaerobaculia bacterium]